MVFEILEFKKTKISFLELNNESNLAKNESISIPNKIIKKECKEAWFCLEWSECISKIQKRVCLDVNNCNTAIKRPPIEQTC